MKRKPIDIAEALDRLRAAADVLHGPAVFMEVCGTHTMSAFRCGLNSLLPANVTLLSGPGCPVCVTAQGDIDLLLDLAAQQRVTLCTYGDMLRVPGRRGSLEEARSDGADVRVVYSTMDAVKLAQAEPNRQVVFAAVGFETTGPATAAAIRAAQRLNLHNLSFLVSHKRIIPAMKALLDSGKVAVQGFLCPGHVSVIIGSQAYRPIVDGYRMPCVIAGFEEAQIVLALTLLTEQVRDGRAQLVNAYPQAVTADGNRVALALLDEVFEPADVCWRGLGAIPDSGLVLRPKYARFDAQRRFGLQMSDSREPPGCLCGQVITGLVTPRDCKLFGTACTPVHPIGPCMVSSEGTCQAWFKYRRADDTMSESTEMTAQVHA